MPPSYTDISLFDELEGLGDADELFKALEGVPYVSLTDGMLLISNTLFLP